MRSFKTFLAEQDEFGKRSNRPSPMLQGPGQMPASLGAGGTGGGGRAPRAARRPFEAIRRKLNFPFNLLPKGHGVRSTAKLGTAGGIAYAGYEDTMNTLQSDVNDWLQQSGYSDVKLTKDQAFKAFKDLKTKDQKALATSLNAFRDYYIPAVETAALGVAAGNPLAAAVPSVIDKATSFVTGKESTPTLDARRAVSTQVMKPFSAKGIFSGENPKGAQAGVNFIANVENMAKGIRTRRQGMMQNVLYPGRGPEPPKTDIKVDLNTTSTRRTPRTNR